MVGEDLSKCQSLQSGWFLVDLVLMMATSMKQLLEKDNYEPSLSNSINGEENRQVNHLLF